MLLSIARNLPLRQISRYRRFCIGAVPLTFRRQRLLTAICLQNLRVVLVLLFSLRAP